MEGIQENVNTRFEGNADHTEKQSEAARVVCRAFQHDLPDALHKAIETGEYSDRN